jgi:hypothetical protein
MRALFILASSALVPTLALARPSSVDWERRVVRCGGTGAPNLREAAGTVAVTRAGTERAARRAALRDCMAALGGLSIETGRTVAQVLAGDAGLASSVKDAVKRVRSAVEPRFFSDGGVELRVEVPLDGDISELLLRPPGSSVTTVSSSPGRAPDAALTGVLVDASGQVVARALAPRILDEAGAEVYGPSALSARARRGGTAAYAADVASARQAFAARLGAAPRVVRAIRAQGADVVVSAADADAIRGSACLAEGRVIIVTHGGRAAENSK